MHMEDSMNYDTLKLLLIILLRKSNEPSLENKEKSNGY